MVMTFRSLAWLGTLLGLLLVVLWIATDDPSSDPLSGPGRQNPQAMPLEARPTEEPRGQASTPESPGSQEIAAEGVGTETQPSGAAQRRGGLAEPQAWDMRRLKLGNSLQDREKALARLGEIGFKGAEAAEIRSAWESEMNEVEDELERIHAAEPHRSLIMDRAALVTDAYQSLRETLDEDDFAAARYAAGESTRVEVYRVARTTLAEELGVQPGDHYAYYDGQRITDVDQLKNLIRGESDPNRIVVLGLQGPAGPYEIEVPGGELGAPLIGLVAAP